MPGRCMLAPAQAVPYPAPYPYTPSIVPSDAPTRYRGQRTIETHQLHSTTAHQLHAIGSHNVVTNRLSIDVASKHCRPMLSSLTMWITIHNRRIVLDTMSIMLSKIGQNVARRPHIAQLLSRSDNETLQLWITNRINGTGAHSS